MTLPRNLIQTAFPGQVRMQQAFEALVNDAETATANLNTALEAIGNLGDGAEGILAALADKQPKNAALTSISILGSDPGVLEQVQAGIYAIRPVDTADTAALITRALADTRYLGGAHAATSITDGDKGDIVISGGVWSFDSSVVTAFARTLLDDTTQAAALTTLGAQPVDPDLTSLAAATGTNTIYYRSAANTWSAVTIGSGLSFAAGTLAASGGVTPAALTKTDDTNVTLTLGGTPATALLQATSITVNWAGQLAVGRGGTGIASYAVGDIVYASAATTLSKLAAVATGNVLISGGVTTAPSWGKVGLTTHVSGTLPVANGGTGTTTSTGTGSVVLSNGPTLTSPGVTALTLLNSVTNVGGAYATAGFRKYAEGRVSVEGWLQGGGGTSPVNIATLPAGSRPVKNEVFPCVNFAAGAPFAGMFEVQATGGVFWYSTNTSAAFSISGINFQT